ARRTVGELRPLREMRRDDARAHRRGRPRACLDVSHARGHSGDDSTDSPRVGSDAHLALPATPHGGGGPPRSGRADRRPARADPRSRRPPAGAPPPAPFPGRLTGPGERISASGGFSPELPGPGCVSIANGSRRTGLGRCAPMKKLFRIFFLLLIVVAAAAALYAWASSDKKNGKGKLVEVATGSITEKALAVGQIEPRQKFSIKSTITGIVKHSMIQVGDRVKTGDPLFEIGPDPTPTDITSVTNSVSSTSAALAK